MVTYKRGDTAPPLRDSLVDSTGVAINLTGATVLLILHKNGDPPGTWVSHTATIVAPATDGIVEYSWATGDLDVIGLFEAEWQVTYASGKIESFPGETNQLIRVRGDLNPPP